MSDERDRTVIPHPRLADRPPLPLLWFKEIEPVLESHEFVQGLLLENSSFMVYGPSNSGKTFWTTDLALHIAAGREWRGLRVIHGGVIYCTLEGGQGFRNRVAAWKQETGLGDYHLPFVAIPCSLDLLRPDGDTDRLIQTILLAAEQMAVPLRLVVIDTLARAMAGGNENASEDMGRLIANMDTIRERTKAAVGFVHHSGKDQARGARGHSNVNAALDTEIEISKDDNHTMHRAVVSKQRELSKGQTFEFTLRVVELGANQFGEPVTSCVVDHQLDLPSSAAQASARQRLSGHARRALEILEDICARSGQDGHSGVPASASSVPEQWWRDAFYDRAMPGDDDGTKQKAFRRAALALVNSGLVGMASKRVWVAYRPEE